MKDIGYCVGTGYGRDKISFINEAVTEIACHGKGARWLVPSARTVIDIGGQDCKAMRLDAEGDMVKFITNDKCASGTGRFLEVMAKVLHVDLDDLGEMSARRRTPITLASACTVWAQADVIQHLNNRVPIEDIAAGINNAMASRMAILANNIGFERDVFMTGGVAKNDGVVTALEKLLGLRIKRITRADPQLAGAIGAALFARKKRKEEMHDCSRMRYRISDRQGGHHERQGHSGVGSGPGEDGRRKNRPGGHGPGAERCGRRHEGYRMVRRHRIRQEAYFLCEQRGIGNRLPRPGRRVAGAVGPDGHRYRRPGLQGHQGRRDRALLRASSITTSARPGPGRFLEIIAEALDIKLEDLGDISSKSTKKITLSNQCVVFAETEIISLVNDGRGNPRHHQRPSPCRGQQGGVAGEKHHR